MKTRYIIPVSIVILMALLSMVSCNNYLEMPAQGGFNKDSVFVNYRNTEKLLFDLYRDVPHIMQPWGGSAERDAFGNYYPYGLANMSNASVAISDEASSLTLQSAYNSHRVYAGAVNSTWFTTEFGEGEDKYNRHYSTIRRCFIILENIDKVPDATVAIKSRIKAECQTIIAEEYFELLKRYGGVPLVKKSYTATDPFLSRTSVEETYNYIIELLDKAITSPDFPAVLTPIEFGRATKAMAYGYKARTMLYAASQLFNSATPYVDFGTNNKLICFGNYDKNRWKLAKDAAKAAIDYCESNGYAIVNNQGITRNYQVACTKTPKDGNTEIMFGTFEDTDNGDMFYTWAFRGRNWGSAANAPTQNAVEFYSNTDGSKVNWDVKITTPPNQPDFPYKNLDPRFQQSFAYNGATWCSSYLPVVEFYDGATPDVTNGREGKAASRTEQLFGFRKYFNDLECTAIAGGSGGARPMAPIMRLTEMYFIYAEASNEFDGPTAQSFDYMDVIRARSGMPVVNRTLTQDDLREFIVGERAVEFIAENHRYFDLKRWKRPIPTRIYNMKIFKYADGTYTYEKVAPKDPNSTTSDPYAIKIRYWADFWFLHPFPIDEINKGYGLVQNPGW